MAKKNKQKIVWFSWKDMDNPAAGGAEVVTDQLLSRSVADGHEAILVCAGYEGATSETVRNGYKIVRAGNRFTVYFSAWRYYRKHLKGWATLAIDECNTIPFFAGWYSGVRTISFFHMLCRKIWFYQLPLPFSLVGWLAEPVYLRLMRRGQIITVSESTKADLIRNGFKAKDITIISEGINIEPVKSLDDVVKYKDPTLLSLGSMRSMKRTLDQVKAFELARKDIHNLKFIVAGDSSGKYGREVLKGIEQSEFRHDITLLGRISQEKKKEVMGKSHLLLVTSIKEGWGLVVTEAASQGTPSVVYDVDGLRDSVHSPDKYLLSAENTVCMANNILKVLSDDNFYDLARQDSYNISLCITFSQSYNDFVMAVYSK